MRLTRRPDPHVRRWQLAWLTFAGLLAGIFALAYVGRIPRIIALLPHYDIWGHLVLYGLLAYLTHRGLQRGLQRGKTRSPWRCPRCSRWRPSRSCCGFARCVGLARPGRRPGRMLIALGVDVLWLRWIRAGGDYAQRHRSAREG